jgi:hypothetical protein
VTEHAAQIDIQAFSNILLRRRESGVARLVIR